MYILNIKGKLVLIERPWVMGIFNATPDSFYEGHLEKSAAVNVETIGQMISDGAMIIDIGGQSTRPGSKQISAEEEVARVLPVIVLVKERFPDTLISIDTFYAAVAEEAVAKGADIVNDISGGTMDDKMLATVGALKVPYICMHIKGTPQTMTAETNYKNILVEMMQYFNERIIACRAAGIKDIIIDPGFGFAKTTEQNFLLLNELEYFKALGLPLLVGFSRKRMIWNTLGTTANEALNGTTVLNSIALQKGASIIRVHDVKEAVEAVKLVGMLQNEKVK